MWIAIGILSFFLVVALVLVVGLSLKAKTASDPATDDYAHDEPDGAEPMDEPDVDDYPTD